MSGVHRRCLGAAVAASVAMVVASAPSAAAATDCSKVDEKGYAIQQNLHASRVLVECGLAPGGDPNVSYGAGSSAGPASAPGSFAGNTALNLITGTETLPDVTQSESMIAVNGADVAVAYNDSRTTNLTAGISVSHDGGASFNRLTPSPFTGLGNNRGDPVIVYNQKLATWFAGWLAAGCGGQGIGLWTATNPDTWTPGACAVTSTDADRESMCVDNNPTSPFYGRMYIGWNDFTLPNAGIRVTTSDNGTTWSAPVTLNAAGGFLRQVQIACGPDGTVFQAALNEGGGGTTATEQNLMYRSTDGGATFTSTATATIPGTFEIPGNTLCSGSTYFPKIQPIWRQTGYGSPGVGPNGVVHYDYAAHGTGVDEGDVFYVRSTDNGTTWSAPLRLNTDAAPGREQWMPSLSVTPSGVVVATWYDRRNTTDNLNYQRFMRVSIDNGATWGADQTLTPLIPQPTQPDPGIQACYAGDYDYPVATDTTTFASWTDGRAPVSGVLQQDVFAAVLQTSSLSAPVTVSVAGSGSGAVSGPGINCPGDCTETYADATAVTLSAAPGAGSSFTGFGGDCTGTAPCALTVDAAKTVAATFAANKPGTKIKKSKVNAKKATAKFTFKGTGLVDGFQCALKKPKKGKKLQAKAKLKYKSCKSPRKYKNLDDGKYTFYVRAKGPGGKDATPAKKKFRI